MSSENRKKRREFGFQIKWELNWRGLSLRLGRANKFVLLSAFTYICHISQRGMTSSDILNEIKRIAKEVLPKGGQLILYGSRARNEAREDSDWDLLILLDKQEIEKQDRDEVAYPFRALSWDVGELISPIIYTKESWRKMSFTPFYKNVEQDGIVLA